MGIRAQQRADTRERIIDAAVEAFSDLGFRAASTRDIATRAETTQGLITYHFRTKDELWRAAADRIFQELRATLGERIAALGSEHPREQAREVTREYVRFVAKHPQLFRLMVEEGKHDADRMQWLVDTHLKPLYEGFARGRALAGGEEALHPHAYYMMAGAASVIFAVTPECRRLTGMDPRTTDAIERHAEFVARMLVP